MADRDDEVMMAIATSISVTYSILVDVCQALPVPITMPIDRHIPVTDAFPAIQRVADLAEEVPMGEEQTMRLYTGCIHLLAGIELYALCAASYADTRAEGAAINLIHANSNLEPLLVWLLAHGTG
ncbi:hypothetical protein JHN59_38160 [Streptomyces sp. MBT49]|uniref:hypothetical protein n=1 Tax=Streptomyces sp. MBT49 TaxID=1488380 RepID=UPI00190930D7|nr:hypothetical protein [Streptomyces sp. MBT49]MBK3630524.1 hypothetical protein [Streptomyces sp. MBT49]